MYLPDLSPYPYEKEYRLLGTVSIGWLDKKHHYPLGETSETFKDRLFMFCLHPVIRMRGFHKCEFCVPQPSFLITERRHGAKVLLGDAEIRIVYNENVYAAPNLVYHYVVKHHYRPPDVFIEAVLHGALPDTEAYMDFIRSHKIDWW